MIYNPSNYRVDGTTMTLLEIYPTVADFKADYNEIGMINTTISDDNLSLIYYVLMGVYADSATTNSSLDMFRFRFFTRIMDYAPIYIRELKTQKELLEMADNGDIEKSSEVVYNTASNPSKKPPVNSREPLNFIDNQSATLHKRSRLDALSYLHSMLDGDASARFIARFDDLFRPILYGNEAIGYTPIEYTIGG